MHEKTIRSETVFTGRVVRLEIQDVELENGQRAYREIVRHKGAVAVLARRPDGCYVFVRQYRTGAEKIMLEVVAGILDPGEAHESAARRELREETGHIAVTLARLGTIYPTPGYVDERIEAYYADVDQAPGPHDRDHDERLEVVVLSGEAFEACIARGEVEDAKTLALWSLHNVGQRPRVP